MPKRADIQTVLIMGVESWSAMQAEVLVAVKAGGIEASDPNHVTWLPPERWQERVYSCPTRVPKSARQPESER